MQLYIFPPSQNSLRVQAVANHLGINLELIPIDLTKKEQLSEAFLKINPNHKIPTLVDDGFVLSESVAIMLYLAEMKPEVGLIPSDDRERMKMHQWMSWHITQFGPACAIYQFENLVKPMMKLGEPDPEQLTKADENFHRFAGLLDQHLSDSEWLVGNAITLADHTVGSHLVHAERSKFPIAGYGNILRWWEKIIGSDPWQKALPDMDRVRKDLSL